MFKALKGVNSLREDEGIEGFNQGRLFFSNRLEKLLLKLKANLFDLQGSVFAKRLLLVPSHAIEKWIRLQLTDELGVAAGFETSFLNQGILSLCHNRFKLPTKIELIVDIEQVLAAHLDSTDPIWQPLVGYVGGRKRRTMMLAKQLATLFQRYSIYGVKEWSSPWQQLVWEEVFSNYDDFLSILKEPQLIEGSVSIHLFGFSHQPPLFFHFFDQVAQKMPVHHYVLSPCQEFWSEFDESQPLLATLGKAGRQLATLVEEGEIQTVEDYSIEGITATQEALLNFEPLKEDPTIELHIASTPHREVEILYHNLMALLPQIEPKEILVMAPDITLYTPYIESVFGSLCQITDLPQMGHDLEIKGLWLLFDLEKKRWSAPVMLELFRHPLFQKKMGWNEETVLQIREWLQVTGIRWGVDAAHRSDLLGQKMDEEGNTWKQGIDQLLEDLALGSSRIDLTEAELLGELAYLIDTLYTQLKPLHDGTQWTLVRWSEYLQDLYEAYFVFSNESLLRTLKPLKKLARDQTYTFQSFFPLLQEVVRAESTTLNPNEVQAIRFCSLLPMRAIPAKVICLIGMNHDAFPRQEMPLSLDQLQGRAEVPSQADLDRYLFLETMLSVREKLFISYLGNNPFDGSEEPPSSVIAPLLPYIKKVKHPLRSYDPLYFSQQELTSTSIADYQLAVALQTKQAPEPFFLPPQPIPVPPGEHHIAIYELVRALRSPLRHYFSHLNFYDATEVKHEEEFTLSPLQMAKMRRLLLQMPQKQAVINLQKRGEFPLGPFSDIAQRRVEKELQDEMVDSKEASFVFDYNKETSIHITGKIDGFTNNGLLAYERGDFAGAIKAWPLYVLACHCHEPIPLIFGRDGKKKSPFFTTTRPLLERMVEYYFLSQQCPSPLFPNWVDVILKQDRARLEKLIATSYDPALAWVMQTKALSPTLFKWDEQAKRLYGEMRDAWF